MKTKTCILFLFALRAALICAAEENYKTLDFPGAVHTFANGTDGSVIVGTYSNYESLYPFHGFFYDGNSFSSLDFPGSDSTVISDIDSSRVVGFYDLLGHRHGFVYENGIFATLDHPLTDPRLNGSEALGISGNTIVGTYMDVEGKTHDYVVDGADFKTLNNPFASNATATAINGSKIVGSYLLGGAPYGYIYTSEQRSQKPNHESVLDTLPLPECLRSAGFRGLC